MKDREFVQSEAWNEAELKLSLVNFEADDRGGSKLKSNSFSGNERNRMFLQTKDNFDEVSHVSGADFRQDGRGFALLDYDQDGWLDMGVICTQRPKFRILRNTIGDGESGSNQSVFVGLVGGHQSTESQEEWSSRDAFGATLLVQMGTKNRIYQHSCGEGLSTQNSRWIHISLADAKKIDKIKVTWPSGKQTVHEDIMAGDHVLLHEDGQTESRTK